MTVSNAVTKPKTGKGAVIGTQGAMVLMAGWLISVLRGRRKGTEASWGKAITTMQADIPSGNIRGGSTSCKW